MTDCSTTGRGVNCRTSRGRWCAAATLWLTAAFRLTATGRLTAATFRLTTAGRLTAAAFRLTAASTGLSPATASALLTLTPAAAVFVLSNSRAAGEAAGVEVG
jgi:hypothetical protein